MKIVVFTAIFGDIRDRLQPIKNLLGNEEVQYHAYVDGVDKPQTHDTGWELRPAVWAHATNARLRARRHKILSHELYPDADFTLWVDGCLTPVQDPTELVKLYFRKDQPDMYLFQHMQRNCVYQEAEACIRMKKDDPNRLRAITHRYKEEGYPHNNGLAETTAMLRKHTRKVKEFNGAWWSELRNNSIRDQMSFDYMVWRRKMRYGHLRGIRTKSPHFSWKAHR